MTEFGLAETAMSEFAKSLGATPSFLEFTWPSRTDFEIFLALPVTKISSGLCHVTPLIGVRYLPMERVLLPFLDQRFLAKKRRKALAPSLMVPLGIFDEHDEANVYWLKMADLSPTIERLREIVLNRAIPCMTEMCSIQGLIDAYNEKNNWVDHDDLRLGYLYWVQGDRENADDHLERAVLTKRNYFVAELQRSLSSGVD